MAPNTQKFPPENHDFDDASKGLISSLKPCVVKNADGRVVWDNDQYSFLEKECPVTANPSLWRQAQLCQKQGLFEVCETIYQVRGLDLSNISFIETPNKGVVIIDPLTCVETAAAAMKMYQDARGPKPVKALIYTHSHADHFAGAEAVLPKDWQDQKVEVFAPHGFLEHAISENVYAGNAMTRRAVYMYGDRIPKAPDGQIGAGLGQTMSTGRAVVIPPSIVVDDNKLEYEVDGLKIQFQMTPGTEAPAEMNIYFPDYRALCMAENATHTMHNIQTLRGAQVRDARVWSRYMDESLVLFGDKSDVEFASHHWPMWGTENIKQFLSQQRDMYAYLHDQTLRMLNSGMTGIEISDAFQLPDSLVNEWHAHGYYGSVSHNVRGIYHRYMGWYDGNPAHLWEHPPVQAGKRYVDCMGGFRATVEKARAFKEEGDLRFAATLLSHAVFADPDYKPARDELALVFKQLGYGCENGPWRNEFICASMELTGPIQKGLFVVSPESMVALDITQFCDTFAIRVDGLRAQKHKFTIAFQITDLKHGSGKDQTEGTGYLIRLSNGALTHRGIEYEPNSDSTTGDATLTLWLTHRQMVDLVLKKDTDLDFKGIKSAGDKSVLGVLFSLLTDPDPGFAIVTP